MVKINNKRISSDINKLNKFIESIGYKLILQKHNENIFCPYRKIFRICVAQIEEYMLYTLLHEIGHYILYNRSSYVKKYGDGAKVITKKFAKTLEDSNKLTIKLSKELNYRILFLKEEIDAWDEGLKFANKNNIKINLKNWNSLKNIVIKNYCYWVYNPRNANV